MPEWVKNSEVEITKEKFEEMVRRHVAARGGGAMDLGYYGDQLYNALCLSTSSSALSIVKNCKEHFGYRGSLAWWKITREVASRSGVRLGRLADAVHHPKRIVSYASAKQELEDWDALRKELEKIEAQPLSDLTKRTTLKKLLLQIWFATLSGTGPWKSYEDAWKFALEQCPLRKEWKTGKTDHQLWTLGQWRSSSRTTRTIRWSALLAKIKR